MADFHARIAASLNIRQSDSADLGTPSFALAKNFPLDFPFGTGDGTCQQVFSDTRTLALSTAEDLDLSGSTLKDNLNHNLAFTKVMAIFLYAHTGNGSTIAIKPGASNGFNGPFGAATHKNQIPAGGWYMAVAPVAGWPVTASTGDLLNIGNDDSGAAATYDIIIIGH